MLEQPDKTPSNSAEKTPRAINLRVIVAVLVTAFPFFGKFMQ